MTAASRGSGGTSSVDRAHRSAQLSSLARRSTDLYLRRHCGEEIPHAELVDYYLTRVTVLESLIAEQPTLLLRVGLTQARQRLGELRNETATAHELLTQHEQEHGRDELHLVGSSSFS